MNENILKQHEQMLKDRGFLNTDLSTLLRRQLRVPNYFQNDAGLSQELRNLGFDPKTHTFNHTPSFGLNKEFTYSVANEDIQKALSDTLEFRFTTGLKIKSSDQRNLSPLVNDRYHLLAIHTIARINAGIEENGPGVLFEKTYTAAQGPLPTKAQILSEILRYSQTYNERIDKALRIIKTKTLGLITKTQGIRNR